MIIQSKAAFSGHSSITRFSEMSLFVEEPLAAYAEVDEEESSVATVMRQNKDRLPPFHSDCGVDDPLKPYEWRAVALPKNFLYIPQLSEF